MRAGKLLLQITAYYVVIGVALIIAVKLWPELRGYLPVGGVEQLITQPAKNPLEASEAVRAAHVGNLGQVRCQGWNRLVGINCERHTDLRR